MTLVRTLIVCCSASVLCAQSISFLSPVKASVSSIQARGTRPACQACLAVADFNGDGKPDLVVSGGVGTPLVGVLLGNGDGTFRPGIVFPYPGPGPADPIAVGDFNGDGKPDVAFLDSRVSVFLGKGDGTFDGPFFTDACTPTSSVTTIVAADVNADGKQDLMCGPNVALSNGDGSFRAGVPLDGAVQLTADLNRDGIPDAVIASASGPFAVVLGRGAGAFSADRPITAPLKPGTLIVGDFNGDGYPDLAASSSDGTQILILPGRGDGTFGGTVATSNAPGDVTVAGDFNRDGKLDLIAGYSVLAGNGDGTFRFPTFIGVATEPCRPDFQTNGGTGCPFSPDAIAVADFNGDGLPDLAAGYYLHSFSSFTSHSVSVMLNDTRADGFTVTGVLSATGNWPVAPGSLVSAFGTNLAPQTQAAATTPLPTTLGGIRLHVRDRSHAGDTLAPLLYVSPTQINYVLNSSDPFAWVDIERLGAAWVPRALAVPIAPIAPGLFFIGQNLAAANVGAAPTTRCSGPICNSSPIDLSSPPSYLSLYGTGFASASTAGSTCSIAGQVLPVLYAGPQQQTAGLDQINVLLPPALAGTGDTSVSCSIAGTGIPSVSTNTVRLNIR